MDKAENPSTPSLAYEELCATWEKIEAIREGAQEVREKGQMFLIKFPAETDDEYKRRLMSAPWRPEFEDCIKTLSAKPFTKQVALGEGASQQMQDLAANIDGRGNNLHVFAKDVFECAVAMGAAGILVEYPSGQSGRTVAEERAAGVRPYWVPIDADDILEITREQRGGRQVVTRLRIKESRIERNGFEQKSVDLIREIRAENGVSGEWTVWKEVKKPGQKEPEWVIDAQGTMTLAEVPFVYIPTNDLEGDQYVKPPLLDLADMQIELYNAMSKKEQAFTMTASPMLTANGMAAPENGVIVTGPGRVLFAPGVEGISTGWAYLQPNAQNLKEIREDIREIIEDMRRIGMQPMTAASGNTPSLAYAFDGEKTYTVLQSWALSLKDGLEQAFVFTAMWLKQPVETAPTVIVHTDFAVGMYGGTEITEIAKARYEGQISRETFWEEWQRRGVIGPQFDPKVEEERLKAEAPDFTPPADPLADPNQQPA